MRVRPAIKSGCTVAAVAVAAACTAAAVVTPVGAAVTGAAGGTGSAAGTPTVASAATVAVADSPTFDQPYSWHSNTTGDAPKAARGWDPINTVILFRDQDMTAKEQETGILSALRKEKGVFWDEAGAGTTPSACLSPQEAAVQPGAPEEAVQRFSWRTITCPEALVTLGVTNHARVYPQNSTGAWFVAVGEESACVVDQQPWDCITGNGYDQGRADLVAQLKDMPGYQVSVRYEQEYPAGKVPQDPNGYQVPFDGRVAVVTIAPKRVGLSYRAKDWKYRQVAWKGDPGFEDPSYSARSWSAGQAGFGTTNHVCSWNKTTMVHTHWRTFTDMLARHWITIPRNATNVHIEGTIDNDATVYINGHQVLYAASGNCKADAIDVTVPAKDLDPQTLLAIRGHDTGVATYLDVTVTYDLG